MSAFATPIEVVQAALHRCGEESIASLSEGTPAALVATSNYEGIVRSMLTMHAWTFATKTVNLTLQGAATSGDFDFAWIWPADVLNVRAVLVSGRRLRMREYCIEGKTVLTQDQYIGSTVQVVATVRAPESQWPDDFAEGVVTRLQGLFIESLADKWQDGRIKIKDSKDIIRQAITRDKRQQPATTQEFNALGDTWRLRGRRNRYLG